MEDADEGVHDLMTSDDDAAGGPAKPPKKKKKVDFVTNVGVIRSWPSSSLIWGLCEAPAVGSDETAKNLTIDDIANNRGLFCTLCGTGNLSQKKSRWGEHLLSKVHQAKLKSIMRIDNKTRRGIVIGEGPVINARVDTLKQYVAVTGLVKGLGYETMAQCFGSPNSSFLRSLVALQQNGVGTDKTIASLVHSSIQSLDTELFAPHVNDMISTTFHLHMRWMGPLLSLSKVVMQSL